ncbi:hypothetical protein ACJIZ3_005285 [Penstemon smallii]|uniref:Metallo-beta-lactamase domain-containing protein n=1 Tax=Penstemon smallii TaxID=265156 RepID=A0ABD3S4E8_9LAMI
MDLNSENQSNKKKKKGSGGREDELFIEGYKIEGLSIAGHETCVILPTLNCAFDIGKCPQRAVSQQFLFISHGHMDHIGGLPMYVATRGLYRMAPPTIIVPKVIKENVEKIFEAHRAMDQSELKHTLIGLDVGEEFCLRKDLIVRAFKTYHVIPSQGYIVYSVKQKLKSEYIGLLGVEIKKLKLSGVEGSKFQAQKTTDLMLEKQSEGYRKVQTERTVAGSQWSTLLLKDLFANSTVSLLCLINELDPSVFQKFFKLFKRASF